MAWIPVPEKPEWEFSDSPDTDKKPIDHYNYNNNVIHEKGRKKIFSGEKYVLARQRGKISPGYGEIYVKDPPVKSLFENRLGLWFDQQDLTTMYQDPQGTLPVYRPGSGAVDPPVGLALDKSNGLELGPELAINTAPNFRVYRTPTENVSYTVTTPGTILVGKAYKWSVKISANVGIVSGNIRTVWVQQVSQAGWAAKFNGTITGHSIILSATNQSSSIFTINGDNVGADFVIDTVSIREIKGYPAYQTTPTARPTLSGLYNLLTATETLSTQSVTTAATDYTLRFEDTGTVTLSGAATGVLSAGTHTITCTAGTLTLTVAGSVVKADLRVKRDGSSLPPYQRVDSATTYDTVGFPLFLKRDRVDDDLIVQAPAITGSWAHGTIDGPVFGTVSIPAGEYHPFGTHLTGGLPPCTQWIVVGGTLSASEQAVFEQYVYSKAHQPYQTYLLGGPSLLPVAFTQRRDIKTLDSARWDTKNITSLNQTFFNASNLQELDTSGWNTSNNRSLHYTFYNCFALLELDVSNWDVSKVTYMVETFLNCAPLQAIDVSKWNTQSCVSFGNMFKGCSGIAYLDISSWDTSKVVNTTGIGSFNGFASGATSLKTVVVGTVFDNTPCVNFANAFTNTNLNQSSIDAILVSINTAGTSNGVFDQSGGSAPSATGEAAITAMRSRGWTVTVTGGF